MNKERSVMEKFYGFDNKSYDVLFHGSNMIVENPKIMLNGFYKDFGYGFYCTNIIQQAKRWAITRNGDSILNYYKYSPNSSLNIKVFKSTTEDWLQFVVDCRRGIEHNFDIVEGPMADDQIWNYIENYVAGKISKAAFWELIKFNHPTHQIVFCTGAALQTLTFERSEDCVKSK